MRKESGGQARDMGRGLEGGEEHGNEQGGAWGGEGHEEASTAEEVVMGHEVMEGDTREENGCWMGSFVDLH